MLHETLFISFLKCIGYTLPDADIVNRHNCKGSVNAGDFDRQTALIQFGVLVDQRLFFLFQLG